MSEKLYALLFRLYPSQFRHAYREEAIQLFRDRSREEKGFLPTLRLWVDLLADLIVSLPKEYRRAGPWSAHRPHRVWKVCLPSICWKRVRHVSVPFFLEEFCRWP